MTIFNEPRGHVIDANSGSVLRLFGIAAAAFLLVILILPRWPAWIPATSGCSPCLAG